MKIRILFVMKDFTGDSPETGFRGAIYLVNVRKHLELKWLVSKHRYKVVPHSYLVIYNPHEYYRYNPHSSTLVKLDLFAPT